jgi:hypothetical protein
LHCTSNPSEGRSSTKLREPHSRVLAVLADGYYGSEWCFYHFAHIVAETGFDIKQVRKSCRYLARKGLAQYGRGLWTEDGEPFGSGYAATAAGNALVEERTPTLGTCNAT